MKKETKGKEPIVDDVGIFHGDCGSRSNSRENTCYRQTALFLPNRSQSGMKPQGWIRRRREREKLASGEGERKANWGLFVDFLTRYRSALIDRKRNKTVRERGEQLYFDGHGHGCRAERSASLL